MSAEPTRTELRLTRDERLLAGVRGAIERIGSRHGESVDCIDLALAAEKACREAMVQLDEARLGNADSFCTVTIDDFEDRIEVRVEGPRNSAPAGGPDSRGEKLDSFAGKFATVTPAEREAESQKCGGHVEADSSNGRMRAKLVKYFHEDSARS